MTYQNTTDDQASAANDDLADRGLEWDRADLLARMKLTIDGHDMGEALIQAMHDRDRFQRDAGWWEEECRKRNTSQQDAWETQP